MRPRIMILLAGLVLAGPAQAQPGVDLPANLPYNAATPIPQAPLAPSPAISVATDPPQTPFSGTVLDQCGMGSSSASQNGGGLWATGEVLLWWIQGQHVPPLVTTSPVGTPVGAAGVPGLATTSILYGDSRVSNSPQIGGRFTAGYWLDPCQQCGIGGEFFILNRAADHFDAGSPGNPILARPVFNSARPGPDAELVAFPGVLSGRVGVASSTDLLGAGAFTLHQLCCGCGYRVNLLAGYRFLRLADDVTVTENLTSTGTGPTAPPFGTNILVTDHYATVNRFNGGDLGLWTRLYRGRVYLDLMTKLAIGATERDVTVNGSTLIASPGQAPVVAPGGVLTAGQVQNHTDHVFSLVPELRLNLGYQVTDRMRVFVGYNAIWWTNVLRAGEQIDTRVNASALPPGPVPPKPLQLHDSTIWIQGINFGVSYNF